MKHTENKIIAILGPTNTGKTYTAFEKLFSLLSDLVLKPGDFDFEEAKNAFRTRRVKKHTRS